MRLILALMLLIAACRRSDPGDSATAQLPDSACRTLLFEDERFTVCSDPAAQIELRAADRTDRPYRSFVALDHVMGADAARVAFAMNAGMFDEAGKPIGLYIEGGRQAHAINRRKGGGNFHLMPNGVFLVRSDGRADIVTSDAFRSAADIAFATQSGPMLVIDGTINPRFDADGQSRYIRNAVGVAPGGAPIFVISEAPVSFGKLARMMRDELHCRDALYLDGSVSSLWDPASGRRDSFSAIGPMVVAIRRAGSAPGHASHARP